MRLEAGFEAQSRIKRGCFVGVVILAGYWNSTTRCRALYGAALRAGITGQSSISIDFKDDIPFMSKNELERG